MTHIFILFPLSNLRVHIFHLSPYRIFHYDQMFFLSLTLSTLKEHLSPDQESTPLHYLYKNIKYYGGL